MIKFFRKIRYDLMGKNKTGKYLKYAIGEILLVVIGILIALNVNNFNEKRKHKERVIEALKEIHRDLSEDILESNDVIKNYKREDSIINILMTKKMSIEDYKSNNWPNYITAAATYYDLKINTNGFENLMANSDKIPKRYQRLIESLKKIYINDKNDLDDTFAFSKDNIGLYLSYLAQNMDWYNELYYNFNLTEDAINYFLHDPYFKNHLTQYNLLSIENYYDTLYQFRINAEDSYRELTKELHLEDLIASDSTYYKIHAKDYDHFLGTYKEDSTNTAIISIESNKLFYQWNNREKVRLFPISKSSFIHTLDSSFNSIKMDSIGKPVSHYWHAGKSQATLIKTKG
jgi:hypothetical protein